MGPALATGAVCFFEFLAYTIILIVAKVLTDCDEDDDRLVMQLFLCLFVLSRPGHLSDYRTALHAVTHADCQMAGALWVGRQRQQGICLVVGTFGL